MMKRQLAGTALGSATSLWRERVGLLNALIFKGGELADRRNNAIAAFLIPRLRAPGKTFVDVGAHIGSVLGEAMRHAPGPVIGFEAIPAKAEHLRRKFPQAVIHNVALLDHAGETSFFINNSQSGYSSLARHGGNVTEIHVKLERLDSIIESDDVDVVKIDVEGAELGVLRGAEKLVARSRPVIMIESGPNPVMGYSLQDLWQWFEDHDYHLYIPDRISRAARAVTLDVFLDSHEYPRRTLNYFGIPSERVGEISAKAKRLLNDPRD